MKRILGAAFIYSLVLGFGCSADSLGGGPSSGNNGNNSSNGGTGSSSNGTGSSSNNAGQGSFVVGTTGGAGTSTTAVDPDSGCAASTQPAQLTRVNILFLLDRSGSMGDPNTGFGGNAETRWNPVVTTLRAFFQDQNSTGIYASLSFLPSDGYEGVMCKSTSYSTGSNSIKVPLTLLDTAGRQKFLDRLCDPAVTPAASTCIAPFGGTPTRPAVQGTIDYLLSVQQKFPDSKNVIVFLTDGDPSFGYMYNNTLRQLASCEDLPPLGTDLHTPSCAVGSCGGCVDDPTLCTTHDAEVAKVADIIATAPAKSIYLFGVGDLQDTTMDIWATATGNPAVALQNLSATEAASTLKTALENIRTTHLDCNIKIPVPSGGSAIDPALVNVSYVDGSNNVTQFGKSVGCGSTKPSWQYDDPANPKLIKLCPNACDMVQKDPAGKVQVVFGCATLIY